MTAEMHDEFFRGYENDIELFADKSQFKPCVYSLEAVSAYREKQRRRGRISLAVIAEGRLAGEVVIKNISPGKSAELGITMMNDRFKGRGYGTAAERLVLDYVFRVLEIPVLYADSVLANARSRHVLEKVGFRLIKTDAEFAYFIAEREDYEASV